MLIILFFSGCNNPKKEVSETPLVITSKTIEFYESGEPKINELYIHEDGELVLYGFEEAYRSGKIKITGKYSANRKREGLWESFYEDGTSWSIGSFLNGIESGEKRVWYPNGKLRYKGEMKDGKPVGSWQFWDEKGQKTIKVYE